MELHRLQGYICSKCNSTFVSAAEGKRHMYLRAQMHVAKAVGCRGAKLLSIDVPLRPSDPMVGGSGGHVRPRSAPVQGVSTYVHYVSTIVPSIRVKDPYPPRCFSCMSTNVQYCPQLSTCCPHTVHYVKDPYPLRCHWTIVDIMWTIVDITLDSCGR